MIRSSSTNAVLVGVPVHVISVGVVLVNSTPSSHGPPAISVSLPAAERLNTRTRPPQFAALPLSCAHIENDIVPASVNPPEGTRPLIHSRTAPPAVLVHWICVPLAV